MLADQPFQELRVTGPGIDDNDAGLGEPFADAIETLIGRR